MDRQVAQLLAFLDQAYDKPSWHGTNLRGSIRSVTAREAAWRPKPRRHNIWELVVHAAYWKYAAARRFTTAARGSFPIKGSNWFVRPIRRTRPDSAAWRADVRLLDDMHRLLRAHIEQLSSNDLTRTPAGMKVSNFTLISGIAAHDLYHAGQIQLLKRLHKL